MPRLSVIMPVYNGEKHLTQAIESILQQTYEDFEFIIICEYGTNKSSLDIISKYKAQDNRIVVVYNTSRLGIAASLNIGFKTSKSEYLARMDGDDIALPERLAVQVKFMDDNLDVSICGSKVVYIDEAGRDFYQKDHLSENPKQIKADFLFYCFIHHPTIVFRKSDVIKHNLYYDETFVTAEDHELWCRASHLVEICKIPEILLKYRWHLKSASHAKRNTSAEYELKIIRCSLAKLGINTSDEELVYLCRMTCHESFFNCRKIEEILNSFYNLIIEKNLELLIYDIDCLKRVLDRRMYWKHHKVRRYAVILIKSIAKILSNEMLFSMAIYLELNGFISIIKRIL